MVPRVKRVKIRMALKVDRGTCAGPDKGATGCEDHCPHQLQNINQGVTDLLQLPIKMEATIIF